MSLNALKTAVPAKLEGHYHPDNARSTAPDDLQPLRNQSEQVMNIQDQERRRLARELHDGIGQYLVAVRLNLELLKVSQPPLPEKVNYLLSEALSLADQCLKETRSISYLLHPPLLEEVELSSALQRYVEGYAERTGIKTHLHITNDCNLLAPNLTTTLYRMVQEGLTNIYRHSGSRTAKLRLMREGTCLILEISDHGSGIPIDKLSLWNRRHAVGGVGLAGMRERVRQFGGDLQIHSSHSGTKLKAKFPMAARA
jgi:two-component system NarL family sensor kinase